MVPDIFHRDFTPTPYWWEAYTPTAGELVDVPRVGARRDRRRRICGAVDGARTGQARHRRGRARSGRARLWRQHPQWRRRQRRRQYRQELHRPDRRCRARAGRAAAVGRLRRLWPDRPADRGGKDRLLLGKARPLCRRLDKEAFRRADAPARRTQFGGAVRRLHGAARAAARRNRQRLLFRRHGRRAVGQIAPGALLQGAARGLPPARCPGLRQGSGDGASAGAAPDGGSRPAAARSPPAMS